MPPGPAPAACGDVLIELPCPEDRCEGPDEPCEVCIGEEVAYKVALLVKGPKGVVCNAPISAEGPEHSGVIIQDSQKDWEIWPLGPELITGTYRFWVDGGGEYCDPSVNCATGFVGEHGEVDGPEYVTIEVECLPEPPP